MEPVRKGEVHPLQNRDILEIIFKGASLKDLKSFRLVCNIWRLASSTEMRETAKVRIERRKKENPLESFTELVEGDHSTWLSAPAASHFKLYNLRIADNSNFWQLCGTFIKRLELDVEFQSADGMLRVICEDCPNVEHLNIQSVTFGNRNQSQAPLEVIPTPRPINTSVKTLIAGSRFFENMDRQRVIILSYFPSLQNLFIGDDVLRTNLFPSLARLRQDNGDQLNLKKLAINFHHFNQEKGPSPTVILSVLLGTGLELEGLSISSENAGENEVSTVRKLIAGHAATLQKLSIRLLYPDKDYKEEDIISLLMSGTFPKLEMFHFRTFLVGVNSLRFLELAPKLHTLSLHFGGYDDHIRLGPDAGVYPNITQLTVHCSHAQLQDLAQKLPNVQKLELRDGRDESLSLACQLWPKLKSLRLNWTPGRGCTSAEITGYDEEDEERISREGPTGTWRPITVRKANLSSLKYLESFIWEAYQLPNYSCALCGVYELPRLKNLSVRTKMLRDYPPHNELAKFWNSELARFTNNVPPSLENGWVDSER